MVVTILKKNTLYTYIILHIGNFNTIEYGDWRNYFSEDNNTYIFNFIS